MITRGTSSLGNQSSTVLNLAPAVIVSMPDFFNLLLRWGGNGCMKSHVLTYERQKTNCWGTT